MACIIRIAQIGAFGIDLDDWVFLESYDSSKEDDKGYGALQLTRDKKAAKTFATASEALEFWRQQSQTVPLRPDGQPNRPLTAFTAEIAQITYEQQADANV